jgi:hypothetical protein
MELDDVFAGNVTLNVAVPVESVVAVELVFVVDSVSVTTVLGTGWFKVVFVNTALNVTVPPVAGMSVVLALNVRLYVYVTPSTVTVILLLYTVAIIIPHNMLGMYNYQRRLMGM